MTSRTPPAPIFSVFRRLAAAFAAYAGKNGIQAFFLIFAGALAEGFGLVLLVPFLGVLFQHHMAESRLARTALSGMAELGLSSPASQMAALVAAFCVLIILRAGILIARDTKVAELRVGFVTDLRRRIVTLLTGADWHTLTRLRYARLTHLMGADVQQIGLAAQVFCQSVIAVVLFFVLSVLAFCLAPLLALVTCLLLVLGGLAMVPVIRQANVLGRYISGSNLNLMHQSLQFLGGLKLAMSQNLQGGFSAMFRRQLDSQSDMMIAFARQQTRNRQSVLTLVSVFGAIVVLAGYSLLHISPAVLIAFLIILMRISRPVGQLTQNAQQLANIMPAFEKIAELQTELSLSGAAEAAPPAPLPQDLTVVFDHVRYIHPDGSDAQGVQDLSLTLSPGEFLGLKGPSGAGKSTFADLLTGLYPPQAGTITVGGQPLAGGVLTSWRDRISYVAQDPFLISGSVRQNLNWMRPGGEDTAIWQALDFAGAADLVRAMPDGLDTDVGERGSLLSGGERQRIALARALLRQPVLLLLDEATNAIDYDGEMQFLQKLAGMKNRPAIVLISHRAESLSFCTRVLTMADGRFVTLSEPEA